MSLARKVRVMLKKLSKTLSRITGTTAAGSGRDQRRPRRFRPGIEGLEGRLVPATIVVNSFRDVPNPNPGEITLREAIRQANLTAAPDTILLKAGTYQIGLPGTESGNGNLNGDFDVTSPL